MIKQKMTGERSHMEQIKINSQAFSLLMLFLILSILYKQFILQAPVSAYLVELIAFLGSSCYVIVKNIQAGYIIYQKKRNGKALLQSLWVGFVCCMVSLIRNLETPFDLLIGFVTATCASFISYLILSAVNAKIAAKKEKLYENNE